MASAAEEGHAPWQSRSELALISSLVRECNGELGLPLLSRTDIEAAIASPVNQRGAMNETLVRLHFNLATTLTTRRMATIVFLCLKRIGEEHGEAMNLAQRLSRGGYQAWTMNDRVTALFLLASHRAEAEGPVRDRIREAALEARPTVRPQLLGTDAAGNHIIWFGDECVVYAHSEGEGHLAAGDPAEHSPTPRSGHGAAAGPLRAPSSNGRNTTEVGKESSGPTSKAENKEPAPGPVTPLAYELLLPRTGASAARLLCATVFIEPPLSSRPWGAPIPPPGMSFVGEEAGQDVDEREGGLNGAGGSHRANGNGKKVSSPSPRRAGVRDDASSRTTKVEPARGAPSSPMPQAGAGKPPSPGPTDGRDGSAASSAREATAGRLPPWVARGVAWTDNPQAARRSRLRVLCRNPEELADLIAAMHKGERKGPTDLVCRLVRLLEQEGQRALEARELHEKSRREFAKLEPPEAAARAASRGASSGGATRRQLSRETAQGAPPAKRRRSTATYSAAAFVSGEGLDLSGSEESGDEEGSGEEDDDGDQTEWEASASESSGEGRGRRTTARPPFQLPRVDPSLADDAVLRLLCSSVLWYLGSLADAPPFMEPVAWKELGLHDYPEVVREPMDLGSLEAAVVRGPCPSWAEFKRRVSLIWDNCHLYNKPGSDISRAATAMRRAATEAFRRIETSSRPAVRRVVHSGNAAGRPAAAFTAAAQPPPHSLQRPPPPPSRPDPRPQHAMQFAPVAAAAAAGGRGGGGGGVLPPRWGPSQQVPARIPLPWAFGGMMGHEAGMWAGAGYGRPPQYMSPSEAGQSGAHMGAGQAPPWAMWAPHWAPPGHAGQAGQAFIPRAYALPHSHGVPSSQPMAAPGGAPSFLFPGGAPMPYHHVQGPYHGFYQ